MIQVNYNDEKMSWLERKVKETAEKMAGFLGVDDKEIEVNLLDDEEMRRVNKAARGIDKETNVLSFEEVRDFEEVEMKDRLGSIYLAPNFIKKQGKFSLERLLAHGFLHLTGFDHRNEAEAKIMEEKEEEVLESIKSKY